MNINRYLADKLCNWNKNPNRLPLLIKGARQVGKSHLIKTWAEKNFPKDKIIELDLEEKPSLRQIFQKDLEPERLLQQIEFQTGINPEEDTTLIFIDEIQAEPKALLSLRYFYEKAQKYKIIAAGSLLDFVLDEISFPVGRVDSLHLHPVSFAEFLEAANYSNYLDCIQDIKERGYKDEVPLSIHEHLNELLKTYFYIGGMPAVTANFLDNSSLTEASKIQARLVEGYISDFSEYAKKSDWSLLKEVFKKIPSLVGNTKVKYSNISKETRSYKIKKSLNLLETARLITRVPNSSATDLPISSMADVDYFKLFFLDIGLLNYSIGIDWTELEPNTPLTKIADGRLAEQFFAQEILANRSKYQDYKLHYWAAKKGLDAEVDFLLEYKNSVCPIEVKSGHRGRLKSLEEYRKKFSPEYSFVLSQNNISQVENIVFLPLYMASVL